MFLQTFHVYSMIFDNRYLPLYPRLFSRGSSCMVNCAPGCAPIKCKLSNISADLIIFTGNSGYITDDKSGGIPEIWGLYDMKNLANAIVDLGMPNPFMGTPFQNLADETLLPWRMKGKIQGQGVAFNYEQSINDNVWIGANWFAMHAFSRIEFFFDNTILRLSAEELLSLDALRRSMQESVGLEAPCFSKGGFSDIDVYVRFGNVWHYTRKFRRLDAGVRAGILVPSGLTKEINNPASIPFGGNGFWGAYGCIDLEFEMKEDWKVGVWVRMSKRFSRIKDFRLTLAGEQPLFAVFPTATRIDPGLTFIASPYVLFEDLRDGLGIQGKYTLVVHEEDSIMQAYPMGTGPQPHVKWMNEASAWNAEYLTVNVFYDFARVRLEKFFAPIVSFMWDIPVQVLLAKRVSKTNRISLGVVFNF